VEVRCGEHIIIFDGGSGLMPLGKRLLAAGTPIDADILFSHFHLDHVIGLPFFEPY
jgi:phosphoribosyl 1,2-cyclic phosphodiesterase